MNAAEVDRQLGHQVAAAVRAYRRVDNEFVMRLQPQRFADLTGYLSAPAGPDLVQLGGHVGQGVGEGEDLDLQLADGVAVGLDLGDRDEVSGVAAEHASDVGLDVAGAVQGHGSSSLPDDAARAAGTARREPRVGVGTDSPSSSSLPEGGLSA